MGPSGWLPGLVATTSGPGLDSEGLREITSGLLPPATLELLLFITSGLLPPATSLLLPPAATRLLLPLLPELLLRLLFLLLLRSSGSLPELEEREEDLGLRDFLCFLCLERDLFFLFLLSPRDVERRLLLFLRLPCSSSDREARGEE